MFHSSFRGPWARAEGQTARGLRRGAEVAERDSRAILRAVKKAQENRFEVFASTAPGVEDILRAEIFRMRIVPVDTVTGGVSFAGKMEHVMRANLWSRVAKRIVIRVEEFHASTFHELERRAKKIAWARFVSNDRTVRFRVTCRKSKLYHSDAVAERLGKAVVAAVGARIEKDDDDEADTEAQLFVVRIVDDQCTVSVDSSGTLLHRRGYRQA